MDGEELENALAERIVPLLPAGIELVQVGDEVELRMGDTRDGRVLINVSDQLALRFDRDEGLQSACERFLDTVQDFVAEATAEPWPGSKAMPLPSVTVTLDQIGVGFVNEGVVVVMLPPILRSR